MTTVDWKNKAIEKAKVATDLDKEAEKMKDPEAQAEKFQEALNAYKYCLDAFTMVLKWEKNEAVKVQFKNYAEEYMLRAEKIKKMLEEPVEAKPKKAALSEGDKDKNKMRETVMEAIVQEKPNVTWDDIAGLEQAKEALKEAVILPINFPQLFTGNRKPWSGIMLYGPPGTGKSFLAKAVATEAAATFLSVSSANLTSKWLGESEKLVKTLFELARESKPSIIFVDEIDSIATARSDSDSESGRRIKTELLVQMDGLGNSLDQLLVLCATNLPWAIDSALLRRCQKRIYIPLPDARARKRLLEIKLHKLDQPPELDAAQMEELVEYTEGFSGSDLSILMNEAIMGPVRKCQDAQAFRLIKHKIPSKDKDGEFEEVDRLVPCSPGEPGCIKMSLMELATSKEYGREMLMAPPVTYGDFKKTLSSCKASVGQDHLEEFEKFTKSFGQDG